MAKYEEERSTGAVTTKVKAGFFHLLQLLSVVQKAKKPKKVYKSGAIELVKRRQRRLRNKQR